VQSVAVGHETLLRLGVPVVGLGVGWIVQLVPFHRSASVVLGNAFVVEYPPTAVQAVAALHDTPPSVASVAPDGIGVLWIVQLLPFQPSARALSGKKRELELV
jgi:hypothetical protein